MEFAVLRPARLDDLDALESFAQDAGFGFTTLPKKRSLLEERLRASVDAFRADILKPKHESYLFILERENLEIIGVSGLISRIAVTEPFYAYHLLKKKISSEKLKISKEIPILHFIRARRKPTEICTLYLKPSYRGSEMGRLLSFSRFLFMAAFPHRFASVVLAELRGYCHENGVAPFWEAVGRHFLDVSFNEITQIRYAHPESIEEFFPQEPIYPSLLTEEAQEFFGKTHTQTTPALKLLEEQGFSLSDYYDIIDSGPFLFAPTNKIKTIVDSTLSKLKAVVETPLFEEKAIITNEKLDFRACVAPFKEEEGGILLSKEAAQQLHIAPGDAVRYLFPFRKNKKVYEYGESFHRG